MGKKKKLTGDANKKRLSQHRETIKWTESKAKEFQDYKPSQFANLSQKTYADNLPKRPKAPTLPKLTTPGGDLVKDQTLNPSGRPGIINKYRSPSDFSKVYTNALKKISPPRVQKAGITIPKADRGFPAPPQPKPPADTSTLGPSGPNYKPTNKGLSKWGPAVKKGLGHIGPLKVPSTKKGSPAKIPGPVGKANKTPSKVFANPGNNTLLGKRGALKVPSTTKGSPAKPPGPVGHTNKPPSKVFANPGKNSIVGKGVVAPKTMKEIMDALKGKIT